MNSQHRGSTRQQFPGYLVIRLTVLLVNWLPGWLVSWLTCWFVTDGLRICGDLERTGMTQHITVLAIWCFIVFFVCLSLSLQIHTHFFAKIFGLSPGTALIAPQNSKNVRLPEVSRRFGHVNLKNCSTATFTDMLCIHSWNSEELF